MSGPRRFTRLSDVQPYESPKIQVIGNLAQETLATSHGPVYDGGPYTLIPHQPPPPLPLS